MPNLKAEANQVSVPSGSSEAGTTLRVGLFMDLDSGRLLDRRDILNSIPAGANRSAGDQPHVDWYIAHHGLGPTVEATRALLEETFGPGATLTPVLETDRETGNYDLLFEVRTDPSRSFQEQSAFLDKYLSQVPRPKGVPSPTLFWDAPQRAVL